MSKKHDYKSWNLPWYPVVWLLLKQMQKLRQSMTESNFLYLNLSIFKLWNVWSETNQNILITKNYKKLDAQLLAAKHHGIRLLASLLWWQLLVEIESISCFHHQRDKQQKWESFTGSHHHHHPHFPRLFFSVLKGVDQQMLSHWATVTIALCNIQLFMFSGF